MPQFRVVFGRQRGHFVDCHVEVNVGSQTWAASEFGAGLQQAFSRCLEHLEPLSRQRAWATN
jgi:hypothetical protein